MKRNYGGLRRKLGIQANDRNKNEIAAELGELILMNRQTAR